MINGKLVLGVILCGDDHYIRQSIVRAKRSKLIDMLAVAADHSTVDKRKVHFVRLPTKLLCATELEILRYVLTIFSCDWVVAMSPYGGCYVRRSKELEC